MRTPARPTPIRPPSATPAPHGALKPEAKSDRRRLRALRLRIYRAHLRQIRALVAPPSAALRAYERRYRRATATARGACTLPELTGELAGADVVLMGDYHPLAACRAWALQLLRALRAKGPCGLALEYFGVRHQPLLDAFVAGQLDEAGLRRGSGHAGPEAPGAASWASIWPLLAYARRHNMPVAGLDSVGRGPTSLPDRDRRAAEALRRARARAPGARFVALVGQMHLAPGHLPRALAEAARRKTRAASPARVATVYQNCERLWFGEAGLGPAAKGARVLRLGPLRFALMHTSPVVALQAYLSQLEDLSATPLADGPAAAFGAAVRRLARALGLPVPSDLARVQVRAGEDVAFLLGLERTMPQQAWRHLCAQVWRGQSVFVARQNLVYLASLAPAAVGEEAAHYLRHCSQGRILPPPRQNGAELFCHHAFEEALGFLGGKLLDPARRAPDRAALRRLEQSGAARERAVARSALAHLALQAGRRRGIKGATAPGTRLFAGPLHTLDATAHVCGYALGQRLWASLRAGRTTRALGALFCWPHAPLTNYLGLLAYIDGAPQGPERSGRGRSHKAE